MTKNCFEILGGEKWYFLRHKVDVKMIFTDNWKVLVLNFSVMGNTVSFWVKELMEKMIFTDYWKVLFLKFSVVGNTASFWAKKLMEKIIFTDYGKVLVLNFSVLENTVFFESRSWWKDVVYWLPGSYCFELFGGGKCDPFSAKKLMERWYLLGIFELFMIFQDLENTVFRAVA